AALPLQAQDVILDRYGNEWQAKVLEIKPDTIYYLSSVDTTAVFAVLKKEVFMITFQKGIKEVFPLTEEAAPGALSEEELFRLGQQDARLYYKTTGVYLATFGSTIVSPLTGLVVGAVFASTPPADKNLVTSNQQLQQNNIYLKGYRNQAQKRRAGAAAGGFATAVGVYVAAVIIVLSSFP
ncbi:MAG: hypothetical protein LPJ89_01495, partial [Hymenobacteraceae bacterium]|nr:hypothetical protein [Hymenobacteraceae bacterium]